MDFLQQIHARPNELLFFLSTGMLSYQVITVLKTEAKNMLPKVQGRCFNHMNLRQHSLFNPPPCRNSFILLLYRPIYVLYLFLSKELRSHLPIAVPIFLSYIYKFFALQDTTYGHCEIAKS